VERLQPLPVIDSPLSSAVGVHNQPLAGDARKDILRLPAATNRRLKDVAEFALLSGDDVQAVESREVEVEPLSACRRAGDEDSSAMWSLRARRRGGATSRNEKRGSFGEMPERFIRSS
jgi:hypothetical protein